MQVPKVAATLAIALTLLPWTKVLAMDGNKLLDSCTPIMKVIDQQDINTLTSADTTRGGMCVGYISGFIDSEAINYSVDDRLGVKKDRRFCPPSSLNIPQSVRVVVKYLRDHPADLHYPASMLVYNALVEAYPCR